MAKKKTPAALALLSAGILCLTGCSMDVESFLRPPKVQGEQQGVLQALETFIGDSGAGQYSLQYPEHGRHTGAFVLCDANCFPVEDASLGETAVAFYSLSYAPEETHINLLHRQQDGWTSVEDQTAAGSISLVDFADVDGDGMAEIAAGWSTYSSRDHRLALYSAEAGLQELSGNRLFTDLTVGDFDRDGRDDLMLLRVRGNEKVTASLEHYEEDGLHTLGTADLDGHIERFATKLLTAVTDGITGLYVDGVCSSGALVTELLYYDGDGLHAPFYREKENATPSTTRTNGLAVRDVDGDHRGEIPLSRCLAAYEGERDVPDTAWLTVWESWDKDSGEWVDKLTTLVNDADGYLVMLEKNAPDTLYTAYDKEQRLLRLADAKSGKPWLLLQPTTAQGAVLPTDAANLTPLTLYEEDNTRPGCRAWFDVSKLNADRVQYIVTRFAVS